MKSGKSLIVLLLLLLCLNNGCSSLISEKEVSDSQVQTLFEQAKTGRWKRIYDESSSSLKSRFTEQEFSILMNKAVAEMKAVDKSVNLQESEIDSVLSFMNNEYKYSVKTLKLEKNGTRLDVITHWSKTEERDNFRFTSLVMVKKDDSGISQEIAF